MANIKDLKKYIGYEFSSGCYTGDDYKSFQTKYINFLKAIAEQLKATNNLLWAKEMNNCKARAEEIVLREVVFR